MTIAVNGETVPESLIAEEMERLRPLPFCRNIPDPSQREDALQQLAELGAIDRVLLRQQIESHAEPLDPVLIASEIERVRSRSQGPAASRAQLEEWAKAELRRKRTIERLIGPSRKPSMEELRAFFEANQSQFVRAAPEYHAAHIIKTIRSPEHAVRAFAAITQAERDLMAGMTFAEAIEKHSDCSENGGDLGFCAEGTMVEEFEREITRLEPGQRTGVFRTRFGFHIAELRARRPRGPKTFEEVAPELGRLLEGFLADQALRFALARLRAESAISRIH